MRSKALNYIIIFTLLISFLGFSPIKLRADSKNAIKFYNILGHSVGTLVKGIVQGKVKSFKSAAKMILWGSISGYGFYQSKKMIGNGNVTEGVILANISASVTENITRGDNPLAYIGYTVGPVRLRFKTPLAGKERTSVHLDISPMDIYTFAWSLNRAQHFSFKNGMINFSADSAPDISTGYTTRGWTMGIYPTVVKNKPDEVYYHESIHAIQYIQEMSLSPKLFSKIYSKEIDSKKFFRINWLNINYLDILNGFTINSDSNSPDTSSWKETEAYSLSGSNK